jgi:hypothetical protein
MPVGQRLDTIGTRSCRAEESCTHGLRVDDPQQDWSIRAASSSFSPILTSPIPTARRRELVLE